MRILVKHVMKKTLIERIPIALPGEIEEICRGARLYDSSSSPEAKVYFIDREGGFYLKSAPEGALRREALMTEYFRKKGLGQEVISYTSGESDLLLTRAVPGEDCTEDKYLDEPKRLCDTVAERLRILHEIDCTDCPITDRVGEYIRRSKENYAADNYNKEHFPDSFGYRSGEEAYSALLNGEHLLKNDVLIHGDYCLPNIMLQDWKFTGFIDLGQAGVGDRHIDLFWGEWSIGFNLMMQGKITGAEAKKYGARFLDAYGRDKIDEEILRVVAAAEVLG